jgi:thiol-disulfide isomerase/thioredoxin
VTRLGLVWLVASVALATDGDPRGWSAGQMAAGAASVVQGPPQKPLGAFPKVVTDQVTGPTALLFFSPTCPHCRRVAPEIERLSKSLAARGAKLVGVASGSASESELKEFESAFGVTFLVLRDTDRSIQAAMGAQSTPSMMLVAPPPNPKDKGKLEIRDLWYPYRAGWDVLVLGRVAGDPFVAFTPDTYVGNNACAACHTQEYGSWELTLHSVAWRTLTLASKERDPSCNRCHVTGAGTPGGWSGDVESVLVDVGCEACHGPGGPHDGTPADPRAACASCHDPDHSLSFSLDRALPLIDHYKVLSYSDADFEAARRKLYDGDVPQELIAFPSGNNVGSDKCLACHPVEHDWWSGDPHANAMASLAKEGSTDPDCVRCHATAKKSGPPPTTLDGFDRFGGVGCESCHGPGEAHVAAGGGTTNIQGLGASCPVCVIDAVCTTCHTPKWSPDWNVETKLPRITHRPGAAP